VSNHPACPDLRPPLLREHRIYQADWLLRFYGFKADELLDDTHCNFDTQLDPKCDWALRNLHVFPVEINRADYSLLLRVPGIGVRSAQRIINARRIQKLEFSDIKKLGVVLKRARFFITCKGKYIDKLEASEGFIRMNLLAGRERLPALGTGYTQLSFLPPEPSPLRKLEEQWNIVSEAGRLYGPGSQSGTGSIAIDTRPLAALSHTDSRVGSLTAVLPSGLPELPEAGAHALPTPEDMTAM
jgi:hypothetical protein